jgi:hypothetical protein
VARSREAALTRTVTIAVRVEGYRSPGADLMASELRDAVAGLSPNLPLAIA